MNKRNVTILGATGSIGTQTLDIIRSNRDAFEVYAITAHRNIALLSEQVREFCPKIAVIADEDYLPDLQAVCAPLGVQALAGKEQIDRVASLPEVDIVIAALVGYAGLSATLEAVCSGKVIGLANKETLVVAGELIMPLAHRSGARIIPVDSEHSAIYQCLMGENAPIERIFLTASGGPFRGYSASELEGVSLEQALKHPNWSMGSKVTIDSASLMNKGLEMIEARWLFDCSPERIEVVVHPQSIIHSMVEFADGSIKAQLGMPDMRLPISLALGLGERIANVYPRYDIFSRDFTFERPDLEAFPNLSLAFDAIRMAGDAPCILNAANEVAVEAFLSGEIRFVDIPKIVSDALMGYPHSSEISFDSLEATDREVRQLCRHRLMNRYKR